MDRHNPLLARARRYGAFGVAAASTLVLFTGTANAEPTEDELREQQEELEQEISELNEDYNVALEDHEAAEERLESVEEDLEGVEEVLGGKSDQVRGIAAAAYTGAAYQTLTFVFDADSDDALTSAADLSYLSANNEQTLEDFLGERDRLEALREEEAGTEEEAAEALADAEDALEDGEDALDELQELLADLEEDEEPAPAEDTDSSEDSGGSPPAASGSAQAAVDFARAQIGKPYVWGGTGPDSFDCSGLTQSAWAQAGVSIPRVSQDQWNFGTRVDRSQLQPGDLLFFYDSSAPSHVGIYSGNGKMIHGSNSSKPIAEVTLSDYYDGVYVGAVRPTS